MSNSELTKPLAAPVPASPGVDLVTIRLDQLRFPRLYKLEKETAVAQIVPILAQALTYRGQQATDDFTALTAATLYELLVADEDQLGLKFITMEEIRREVTAAALGSRGELYGVNVASLYRVLKDYALGAGHAAQKEAARRRRVAYENALSSGTAGCIIGAGAAAIAAHSKI